MKRLHEALYLARLLKASVYIVWYRSAPNQAIHLLASPDVLIIRSSRMRDALVLGLWAVSSPVVALKRAVYRVAERSQGLGNLDKGERRRVKRARRSGESSAGLAGFRERGVEACERWAKPIQAAMRRKHLEREISTDPIRARLPVPLDEKACAEAARLGLEPASQIVTLHVRENGWRPLVEDPRSCDITTYREAVEELVARGYQVVRIGDASMTPIDWPGLLDLATEPTRSDLLELWCMLRSVFFLGCDSGPTELARLLCVPMLLVNVKHVQSQYPLLRSDLFIVKRLMPTDEERIVSLREQLGYKSGTYTLGEGKRYIDNSSEEIRAAVVEMLEGRQTSVPETPAQAEFRRLAKVSPVRQGRIAEFFADRYLDQPEVRNAHREPARGRMFENRS